MMKKIAQTGERKVKAVSFQVETPKESHNNSRQWVYVSVKREQRCFVLYINKPFARNVFLTTIKLFIFPFPKI